MPDKPFDSAPDTIAHISRVQELLGYVVGQLIFRAGEHDQSKLTEPEKSAYDRAVPEMRKHKFGTPEYKEAVKLLGPALQHHFEVCRHHPEHFKEGVTGMNLIDVIEMVCDWKAASERPPGDGVVKLDISAEKFGIGDQLKQIIANTLPLFEGFVESATLDPVFAGLTAEKASDIYAKAHVVDKWPDEPYPPIAESMQAIRNAYEQEAKLYEAEDNG